MGSLRLLMLAATKKVTEAALAALNTGARQQTKNMATAGGSGNQVAAAKRRLLANETAMPATLDKLKTTTQRMGMLAPRCRAP